MVGRDQLGQFLSAGVVVAFIAQVREDATGAMRPVELLNLQRQSGFGNDTGQVV
jgi:hypothetical protein